MAAIDKIYGTIEQRKELQSWCEENLPEALEYFRDEEIFPWEDGKEYTIANFPGRIDKQLWLHCPIKFVRERLEVQYSEETRKRWVESYQKTINNREGRKKWMAYYQKKIKRGKN